MYQAREKGEKCLCYNIKQWKINRKFGILKYISEHVTLDQFMETVGNVHPVVSIVGNWIFDSKYKYSLTLTTELLDLICSPSEGEVIFAMFGTMFSSVRYVNNKGKLNIDE